MSDMTGAEVDGAEPVKMTGLLTQPIIPSPIINWILPARVRNKDHNDVVFVGERRIQVKEALDGANLADVFEKNDLNGSPLGAKVINVGTQLPWVNQGIHASRSVGSMEAETLAPQILFLALDSNELLFVYCDPEKEDPFIIHYRPLPRDVNTAEKYGRHIAVDPKSRAVAVSASRNFFGVMWLHSTNEIQYEMLRGGLQPIQSESFFKINGDILFMEFLFPKSMDDKKIILLLIVHKESTTQALFYEWDELRMDERLFPNITTISLSPQDSLPTMIVPLAKESSFLLITTTSMAMYTPHSLNRPMRYPVIIPDTDASEIGLWTRWARPSRNWLYSQRYDGIFLCREDGWIYYLEFGNEGELETQTSLGQLHCDVDTAFDVLDMGHEGGDFILAAGSHGDGGLFVQEARDHPRCVQRFLNWAPVTDAVVVPSFSQHPLKTDQDQDRLFVCSSSSSGNGAITELRYGVEAQIGVDVPLDRFSNIRDMWAMTKEMTGEIYLMIADPMTSVLLRTTFEVEDGISAVEDGTDLDTGETLTLATGSTRSGIIVQVTAKATHFFNSDDPRSSRSIPHDPSLVATTATVDKTDSLVIMTVTSPKGFYLYLAKIVEGKEISLEHPMNATSLEKAPISTLYQSWGTTGLIFLGTGDGNVLVYHVNNDTLSISEVAIVSISVNVEDDISKAIDSLAVIRMGNGHESSALLLCGLRSGILVPFDIEVNSYGLQKMDQQTPRHVGKTSITLKALNSFALFTCGDGLWRISYTSDGNPSDYFLSRVWITDQSCPAYFPVTLSSFSFVEKIDPDTGFTSVVLFCYADYSLLVCSLGHEIKTVPRRIDVPGIPNKLTYSRHLRSLVVSYTISEICFQLGPLGRATKSYIEFVDPDSQNPVEHGDGEAISEGKMPWRPSASSGEKITCIFDWTAEKHGNEYHLIAIGTSLPILDDLNDRQGRVLLFHASSDPINGNQINCFDKYTQMLDKPVYAMAAYRDSLIVASGKSLFPVVASNSEVKWRRDISAVLPSPAIAMTVHGNLIYVTTSRNSTLIYEIVNGDILEIGSDGIARDGLSHALIKACGNKLDMIVVGTRGGSVRVFDNLELDNLKSSPSAELPVSMLRLVQGSKSPSLLSTTTTVYGFALNGSVYRILILAEHERRLLQILLNLCLRDKAICPAWSIRRRRIAPAEEFAVRRHIDGTILARLAERDVQHLKQMLAQHTVKRALADEFDEAAQGVVGKSEDQTLAVFEWLRALLHIKF
ncbi:hypothetical protein PENANT_c013G09623 [Penicillium antarcticum]|uniref:Uncharacterized protein n=1 Tax=Penicillium antarcticum TaxID=416450 RepID=A0A1V6Q531_9EURO|nr:uncharacterized protein N7508_004240 [Penicillium antarcticum]KAJ5308861.1 hypothetical protein N7508_004240 [Penicillium antarcticum]OQD84351.1 hypothetical protein PENANT_c013G09623 [Penicillium antarcticum]